MLIEARPGPPFQGRLREKLRGIGDWLRYAEYRVQAWVWAEQRDSRARLDALSTLELDLLQLKDEIDAALTEVVWAIEITASEWRAQKTLQDDLRALRRSGDSSPPTPR